MALTDNQLAALDELASTPPTAAKVVRMGGAEYNLMLGTYKHLASEVRSLRAAITAADELHRPHDCDDGDGMGCWAQEVPGEGYMCQLVGNCDHDGYSWPCPTHTALHPEEQ